VWMGVVLDDGETDSMKGGHREGFYTRGEIVLDRDQHDLRRIGSVFGQFSETDLLSFPTFPALQFKPTTAHNCSFASSARVSLMQTSSNRHYPWQDTPSFCLVQSIPFLSPLKRGGAVQSTLPRGQSVAFGTCMALELLNSKLMDTLGTCRRPHNFAPFNHVMD
jgi:hypothetical protein